MLEISQALLVATTALITLALGAYLIAVFAARLQHSTAARQAVLVPASGQQDGSAAQPRPLRRRRRGLTWFGSRFVQWR